MTPVKCAITLLLLTLLLQACGPCIAAALPQGRVYLTAKDPIRLDLVNIQTHKKPDNSTVTIVSKPRSQVKLFQDIFGFVKGKPFEFPLDKLRALQACGLFDNLTARSFEDDNGDAGIVISANERRSLLISPEISLPALRFDRERSLFDTQVSGGVRKLSASDAEIECGCCQANFIPFSLHVVHEDLTGRRKFLGIRTET
jgi:hypothetical protein